MSFPKAKNKRFNEIMSCAPPVGSYDPQMLEKGPAALIDSKDERFKEPKPVDSHTSNLSASIVSSHSFRASTPRKLSAASSTDSLASDQSVSGIPKRATSSSNIMAPADLAKQKELERQIRMLVQERNELHRRVLSKDEELKKIENRLQQALKDRTSMTADLASMEKELADLRKGKEVLQIKVQEFNVDRLRQLQTEVDQLQQKLRKKEKEMSDMHDKLKSETEEKTSVINALKQANTKLADLNKEQMKEIEDKSRQLRLLVGNSIAYETEMDSLRKEVSQLKSRSQKFAEQEATLVAQCDRMQLVFSHYLILQKQVETVVDGFTQQMHDSWMKTSEEIRVQQESDVNLLRTSVESYHLQKVDAENLTSDLKLQVHKLIDAAVTDVSAIESVHLDLLTLFSKLIKCQQNEEEFVQSVSTLNEQIKELQDNLGMVNENKEKLQKFYEVAVESLKMEKERREQIESTLNGLLSERTSLETALRYEQELTVGLQGKIQGTEAKILELNETVLSMEKQMHCSNSETKGLLQQNVELEGKLQRAAEERDRLENKLKQSEELNEVIKLNDATYKQLEEERNELAIKLEAVEAERELGQKDVNESCEKLKSLQLRYEMIDSQLSEVNQETKAVREKLVEELNEAKSLVSSQQSQLDDCEAKMAEFERQAMDLEKQLSKCCAEKDKLQQLKDQLELKLVECQAMVCSLEETIHQSSAELGEARAQLRNLEEDRNGILLELKISDEAKAVAAAELKQVKRQLEEFEEQAAMTQEHLGQILSERDHFAEDNQKMKTELEEVRSQSAGYEEQLTEHRQEIKQMREQLSLDAEKITSLENAEKLLHSEMGKKCKELDVFSQQKADLESSVRTLETELCRSQETLACTEELLHERENTCLLLSQELENVKAGQEEAENLVSQLQGEVQTVSLQMEQVEFARTELEVAKAYITKDLSEVNDRLKEMSEEMERVQNHSGEMKARNEKLCEDNGKSLAKIQSLEEVIGQLNCYLVEAKNVVADKEEALYRIQEKNNDFALKLEQQQTEISELKQFCCKSKDEIFSLTQLLNNSTSMLETKTTELQLVVKEKELLLTKMNEMEEIKTGLEAKYAGQTVQYQELTQAVMMLRSNFDGAVEQLSRVQSEKDSLSIELNRVQERMTLLHRNNEELQQSQQLSLKSVAEERLRLSSQLETLSETKKRLELELHECRELLKRRNIMLETMSVEVKDLKRSELLVETFKERYHSLETNSAKELERARQKLNEERSRVEMEHQRQQVMQQEHRTNLDRLQLQLDTKIRELSEAYDRNRRQQMTLNQYSDQLTEISHQHQQEMTELKRILEEKSQHHGDVTLIMEEAQRWKAMYEELWNKVQPFKEQLEAFELEKQLLLGHSKNAQMEIEKLSHDYAKILGHQNQKQKIHHILKLKEENVALKREVKMLRDRDSKSNRQIGQLTEKLDALQGKSRFEPSKAFKAVTESDLPMVLPLRKGNR